MAPPVVAEDRLTSGYRLSHPPPGDEVLITGISGYFADCDSMLQLQENLFNKVDLITSDDRRWKLSSFEIPLRSGKINNLHKFDASFFGINYKEAHTMDPAGRILLEKAYEAIFDAGVNPDELRGSKTGVFVGASYSESEKTWFRDEMQVNGFGLTGCSRAMLANRISYWLGVTGPSYAVDSGCSSSLYALEHAFRAIRKGRCDSAVVCSSNTCLDPYVTLQFTRAGVLSPDGRSKCFDENANGYARSESIVAVFVQKAKISRRAYAQLLYAKTMCDGFKEQGIMYSSETMQKAFLKEFYEECSISPQSLEYFEAHGTGTQVGDLVELLTIDEIFGKNRFEPLKIGAVKSNLGHSEAASGLCAIAKMCIAYTTGYIPPNLNYETPRKESKGLMEGRLEVVTDKTPWQRGLASVNGFGFGGANAHMLLKNIARDKINNGLPIDDLPRLVCVSGRTESSVLKILRHTESRTVDVEFVRLLHSIYDKNIQGHGFRGYILLGSTPTASVPLFCDVQYFSGVRRPVWFVYSGMGSQWAGMAAELMRIPIFAAAIHKCHKVLEPKGIDLNKIITESLQPKNDNILNSFILTAAVQIGLTDLLNAVGIEPDHAIGVDIGELVSAYAFGSFTAEQTIEAAHSKGLEHTRYHVVECSTPAYVNRYKPEIFAQVQHNAIIIGMTPHENFKTTFSSKKDAVIIPLLERNSLDNVKELFIALGHWIIPYLFVRLYEEGLNPHLANVYPDVPFPVSQGTSMLAHLVQWDHSDDWYVPSFKVQQNKLGERTIKISIANHNHEYLVGHKVDGRNIYPAVAYLILVWETFGMMIGRLYTEVSVVFENVRFQRATNIPKDGVLEFTVSIHKESGDFEIMESGATVVSGKIYANGNITETHDNQTFLPDAQGSTKNISYILTKDFYKELRVRGYNISGQFQGVMEWNLQGTHGYLSWVNNWVTFIDCMLQLYIFNQDTRDLYVLSRIDKLSIDVNKHYKATSKMLSKSVANYVEVMMCHHTNVIRSGGVEVHLASLYVAPINKRPSLSVPVLETHVFFPNFEERKIEMQDVLRAYMQLMIQNTQVYNVKSIELADDEYKSNGYKPVLEIIDNILGDLPLIRSEPLLISKNHTKMTRNITVAKNENLFGYSDINVFVGANLLTRTDVLQQAVSILFDKSFIISREKKHPDPHQFSDKYDIICIHNTGTEYLVLFRRRVRIRPAKFVKIIASDYTFAWIDTVKTELKDGQKLVLYSQDEPVNGLMGLISSLRKEPGGETVSGLLIADVSAPTFNPDLEFYKVQINKELAFNVYQDGQWGSYRHLLLRDLKTVHTYHAFVNSVNLGDLSSLKWLEGGLRENHKLKNLDEILVHVYCAALNFRDIMIATGHLPVGSMAHGRLAQDCVQGIEIAGRTSNGTRVMGMVKNSGIANLATGYKPVILPIPDEWSFKEAATVPVAYSTVYYALVMVGQMQRGESILIHAGAGGVGQAAINVALHYGCEVFTTVGTAEKRAFIKKLFPKLKDSHIGNSRDASFELMIRKETKGKGVDLVLNSLSDNKLQASIRCLGALGRFLEIGKLDIINNTPIDMCLINKEVSFHNILIHNVFDAYEKFEVQTLQELILDGIKSGVVRPLVCCTFEKNEVEAAYRYMAAGKHIGKIIINIRDEDHKNLSVKPTHIPVQAMQRYTCQEDHVYIVVGGLGGFGLELADWLILRGARKLILVSRRGVSNGYQASRLRAWRSYGANVQISTDDVTTEAGCEVMLRAANAMGPVEAIFNLAAVWKDAIFLNQTPETFKIPFGGKALATLHLDKLSRTLCPALKDFVVFSSIACGLGIAGQTNYAYSNCIMERICEERKRLGLPGLAIQWGAIDAVGIVEELQRRESILKIEGTLQQELSSCFQTLDRFMKQHAAVVFSIVVAKKETGECASGNVVDTVTQIMGIKDLKTVSLQVPLAELGMDSMTAVEIKQRLEREFGVYLTSQDIRTMTVAKLLGIKARKEATSSILPEADITIPRPNLSVFINHFGDESTTSMPYIFMPTLVSDNMKREAVATTERVMFMLPGLEGCAAALEPLCRRLKIKVCVLQLGVEHRHEDLDDMVSRLHQLMMSIQPRSPFYILGYSFGTLLMLQLAAKLEVEGLRGTLFCLDGAPEFISTILTTLSFKDDAHLQDVLISHIIDTIAPNNGVTSTVMDKLTEMESFEERIRIAFKTTPKAIQVKYSIEFITAMSYVCYNRIKMIRDFNQKNFKKLISPIVLLRPKKHPLNVDINENYGIEKLTESTVTVYHLEENNGNVVDNINTAKIINSLLEKKE